MLRPAAGPRVVLGGLLLVGLVAAGLCATVGRGGIETHGPVVAAERPWLAWGETGNEARVGGVLEWDGDCLLLSGSAVVWPSGTRWDAERSRLRLPGGAEAEEGDTVTGAGGWFGGEEDRGWDDSDAGRATAACRPVGTEVMVFNREDEPEVSS